MMMISTRSHSVLAARRPACPYSAFLPRTAPGTASPRLPTQPSDSDSDEARGTDTGQREGVALLTHALLLRSGCIARASTSRGTSISTPSSPDPPRPSPHVPSRPGPCPSRPGPGAARNARHRLGCHRRLTPTSRSGGRAPGALLGPPDLPQACSAASAHASASCFACIFAGGAAGREL